MPNAILKNGFAIQATNLYKELPIGQLKIQAVRDVSLAIKKGELVSIIGPSGSGKSTLLGLIGGLDSPTSGDIILQGVSIGQMNERALTKIRNTKIGFVFQFFNLIPTLSALENVTLPAQFSTKRKKNPEERAKELLNLLGLEERIHHRPTQLSGGEQQRVAIARALINEPEILLCDEPTGNLDTNSGKVVMDAILNIQKKQNTTTLLVTHDNTIAELADRKIELLDGRIYSN